MRWLEELSVEHQVEQKAISSSLSVVTAVPLSSSAELRSERRFHCQLELLLESVRRQTFANWTVASIDPDSLARAGFFYLQTSDHVQCVFCRGIVGYWDPEDRPDVEHRKHFPNCPFVSGVATGNVPLTHPADDTGRVYRLLDEYHTFRVTSTRPVVRSSTSGYQQGEF